MHTGSYLLKVVGDYILLPPCSYVGLYDRFCLWIMHGREVSLPD